jgi:hypothetical protein
MISFILKFTYSIYQYKHYYKQYYELQQSIYFKEPYIKTLVASYELRIVMLITFVLCICLVPWVVIFVSYVVEFAKNYKITLVEKIKTNIVKP